MRLHAVSFSLLTLLLLSAPALADMGPKPSYYGETPRPFTDMPGIEVGMTAEVVELTLRRGARTEQWHERRPPVFMDVVATFTMTNPSDAPVAFETGFPVGAVPNHDDFTVAIDGESVEAELRDLNPPSGDRNDAMMRGHYSNYWYVWAGTYAPGESMHVVTYTVDLFAFNHSPIGRYILHSGGPWAGPIGHAVVTMDFEGGLTPDCLVDISPVDGGTRNGDQLRWEWHDLDPTDAHDIRFRALSLETWRDKVTELRDSGRLYRRVLAAWHLAGEAKRHLRAELTVDEQHTVAAAMTDIDGLATFDSEGNFVVSRTSCDRHSPSNELTRALERALIIAQAHPYSEPVREALQFWVERVEQMRDGNARIGSRVLGPNRNDAQRGLDAVNEWLAETIER